MRLVVTLIVMSQLLAGQEKAGMPAVASGGRRLALLIGNKDYGWAPLKNPVNDVDAMERMLTGELGFARENVMVVRNGKRREMNEAAVRLVNRVRKDDAVVFYYSGHGTVHEGVNYLMPTDFEGGAEQLKFEAFSANGFLEDLEKTAASVKVMILDACRNQAVPGQKGGGTGLGQMGGRGTLVIYATEAGKTADDNGREGNGLFTKYLLEGMRVPGKPAREMFESVAREVYGDAGGRKQLPWIGGVMLEDFYFKPKPRVEDPDKRVEEEYWEECKRGTVGACEVYVRRYPRGEYAELAQLKVKPPEGVVPSVVPSAPVGAGSNREGRREWRDGIVQRWVPPGSYRMGCSAGDGECFHDEPVKEVRIARGFWMQESEVTQEAYERVTGKNPSRFKGSRRPVETVSWHEASGYCASVGLRLPTEEEWEYAARGGSAGARYGALDGIAWYEGNSGGASHDAKSKEPNAFGLYDMLGNVWEWTASDYDGSTKTLRGGSWFDFPRITRASNRSWNEPGGRYVYYGFRCLGD